MVVQQCDFSDSFFYLLTKSNIIILQFSLEKDQQMQVIHLTQLLAHNRRSVIASLSEDFYRFFSFFQSHAKSSLHLNQTY